MTWLEANEPSYLASQLFYKNGTAAAKKKIILLVSNMLERLPSAVLYLYGEEARCGEITK